ncbi:WXG100 family type VII secretion target [Kitasatospora sp. NPDC101447]|uniref:WXG100 family type VII secretion target n=1 Tax=Kitasatospora sp. NPDC101447 TaxID=3364102 RepID=UPI0038135C8D
MDGQQPAAWSGLGFDPAPGDQGAVTALSATLRRVAGHLGGIHTTLAQLSRHEGQWTGAAADAFAEKFGELPDYLKDASDSITTAYGALDTWYKALAEHQPRAAELERAALAARQHKTEAEQARAAAAAHPDLELAGQTFPDDASLADATARYDAAKKHLDEAAATVRSAGDELGHLQSQGATLHTTHTGDARRTADAIRKAADSKAPPEPGWLDKVGDWFGKHGADLLTVAAGVAGVAAIFFPPLALAAVALSLAAAGAHATQYGAKGLWPPTWDKVGNYLTLSGDLLGAVPLLGAAAKGGAAAVKAGFEAGAAAGARAGAAAGARAGASEVASGVRGVTYLDPQNPLFRVAVEKPALKLGVPLERAQDLSDGVQGATSLALAVPTAATLFTDTPGDGLNSAVNNTTGAANVMGAAGMAWGGSGPAKVAGGVLAVGNAFGLYGWMRGHGR